MLEPFEPQIRAWLEADPAISAASVLQRLMSADPSRFTKKSLRTVQMAVKAWRIEMAGQIILDGDWLGHESVETTQIYRKTVCPSSGVRWLALD
ncbi:hypothetical protein QN224_33310 [Sinorhizobium sp. 8-89]|uniref:hypothetical protein n=1 Tax=Sinorhizobium sp. 7-81 TaxID=3049087 RepID=UPI0024C2BDF1|nr:hypothetical protein [Sinorhizobium sp. 7-81]MDK1390155.1 hypothetical protein [Sinorhizobium sp. 7-81]